MFTVGIIFGIAGLLILLLDSWVDMFNIGLVIMVLGIVMMMAGDSGESQDREECESVGGQLTIVEKEWNGKIYIGIYGCVKD